MEEKKYKQQNNNNNNLCWIFDYKIRDVLPLFIIKLELFHIKNLRLVCRKLQLLIDGNCDKLFNLIFRFAVRRHSNNQKLQETIKKYPIITSFFLNGSINNGDAGDLIGLPDYTKELKLTEYQLRNYEFPSLLESLTLDTCILSSLKWPQHLVYLKLEDLEILSDQILNLSNLSTLSYLKLCVVHISEIDLSNFNSLKSLTYRSPNYYQLQQHIYFPSSSSLETLILSDCSNENVKSTKLPNSLIHLKIYTPWADLISFLLKEENKLPLLQSFKVDIKTGLGLRLGMEQKDIPSVLHQYDQLKLIIFEWYDEFEKKEEIDKMFSYIPPNLSELQIINCHEKERPYIINLLSNNWKQYTPSIVSLFPNNRLKQIVCYEVIHNSLFFYKTIKTK